MKKAKIILLVSLGVSVLGLGLLGVWVGMLVKGHKHFLDMGGVYLEVVPVEEAWEAAEDREEISFGYMSVWLEPNEIDDIFVLNREITLTLKDGIQLKFLAPSEYTPIPPASSNMSKADIAHWRQVYSYDGEVESCRVQPKSHLEYVWMSSLDQLLYTQQIYKKKNPLNQKGMVLFDSPEIKGIFRRGALNGDEFRVDIYGKGPDIKQIIDGSRVEGSFGAEQEAKIRRIVGSMRYLVDELPEEVELEAMVEEAVERIVIR
ncbi:MAG: hypothetical protein GY869_12745 [Planctomycetes bacterium]|nr:hypothetical protein [Planctomycetota bacterium]